jgi:hypothetical protein
VYGALAAREAKRYCRSRDLPKLLPLWPAELADESRAGTALIVKWLQAALRAERRRGIANHWSYDLNRHLALLGAYKAERAALATSRFGKSRFSKSRCGI